MTIKDGAAGEDLLKGTLADLEKHIIVSALKRCAGNQSMAARQLGTTKRMLAYRVRKYGSMPSDWRKTKTNRMGCPRGALTRGLRERKGKDQETSRSVKRIGRLSRCAARL